MPTVDEVLAEPIAVNSMLGTYTNFVNLLDLCALTVPVGAADRRRAAAEHHADRPGLERRRARQPGCVARYARQPP